MAGYGQRGIPMGKRLLVIAGLLVVFALGWSLGRRGHGGEAAGAPAGEGAAAGPPLPVQTWLATPAETQDYTEFPGTVRSRVTAEIAARIAAHILTLPVRAGDAVKEGDVLVTLDDRDVQTRVKQAESALLAATAVLTEAETDYKRYQQLFKAGAESRQQMEQAQVRFETARAGVAQAQEQVKEAKVNLGYTEIRAPFAAIVVDKNAEAGDLAAPGRVLLTIQKPAELRLEAPVSEACARRIHADDPVLAQVDAAGFAAPARVNEIVPAVDPRSRSFLVRADLPPSPGLQPGMFGRFRFPCSRRQAISVPAGAVVSRGQLDYVFVVQEAQARLRLVRLGRPIEGDRREVLSGLGEGDVLILAPPVGLRDLAPVAAAPVDGSAAAATGAAPAAATAPAGAACAAPVRGAKP